MKEIRMPRNTIESIVFTAITCWFMVYIMTLYNIVLASNTFNNYTFLIALKGMWIEFIIIYLCAYFISSKLAPRFAFKVVDKQDRQIVIIIMIQVFTVVLQVGLASILGAYEGYGFTSNFICDYLVSYCRNFIMALPIQLFIVGPIARKIFGALFR